MRALSVGSIALLALAGLAAPAGARPRSAAAPRTTTDATVLATSPFGDTNGDGWPDLFAYQPGVGSPTGVPWLYPGHGSWLGAPTGEGWGLDAFDSFTRHGDFTYDGYEDYFRRDKATGYLYLAPGLGVVFDSQIYYGAGWNTMREITAVGDVNRDGAPDLVAVQSSTGYLYLYTGAPRPVGGAAQGTFTSKRYLGAGWNTVDELAGVGDFNGDGYIDLVARQKSTGYLYLYTGNGTTFSGKRYLGAGWGGFRAITSVGDFNRDGYIDLFAIEKATGYLYLYLGNGAGFSDKRYMGSGWGIMPALF